mmetsp:Transcript_60598/g.138991  ORF Transcript_60598/g.138991 Transcript_60598/m.138991 type:complete len:295 (-) Transcript_60598:411-1295(-)
MFKEHSTRSALCQLQARCAFAQLMALFGPSCASLVPVASLSRSGPGLTADDACPHARQRKLSLGRVPSRAALAPWAHPARGPTNRRRAPQWHPPQKALCPPARASAARPRLVAAALARRLHVEHEIVDVPLPRTAIPEKDLPNMLIVCRPARRERMRVGVLLTRVGVVRDLRLLDRRSRPHLLVEEVEVAHVPLSITPPANQLGHVRHRAFSPPPHTAVERSVVIRVVAQRVDLGARLYPRLDREALPRIEPRVGVAHDKTIDGFVCGHQEAPEHAADAAAHTPARLHVDKLDR